MEVSVLVEPDRPKDEAARPYRLGHSVVPTAEEFEDAFIAKDLKLLADFRTDVVIIGMQLAELLFVVVDIRKPKLGFPQ